MRLPIGSVKDYSAREAFRRIEEWISRYEATSGVDPLGAPQVRTDARVSPPPLATFTVTGGEGFFHIVIVNPVDGAGRHTTHGPLEHELVTSESVPFQASDTRTSVGISTQTDWLIRDPSAIKYWGLRSRYLDSDFNALIVTPTAIDSGT